MKKLTTTLACCLIAGSVIAEHLSATFTLTIPDRIADNDATMELAASMIDGFPIGTTNLVEVSEVDGESVTNETTVTVFLDETDEEKVLRHLRKEMAHIVKVFFRRVEKQARNAVNSNNDIVIASEE